MTAPACSRVTFWLVLSTITATRNSAVACPGGNVGSSVGAVNEVPGWLVALMMDGTAVVTPPNSDVGVPSDAELEVLQARTSRKRAEAAGSRFFILERVAAALQAAAPPGSRSSCWHGSGQVVPCWGSARRPRRHPPPAPPPIHAENPQGRWPVQAGPPERQAPSSRGPGAAW